MMPPQQRAAMAGALGSAPPGPPMPAPGPGGPGGDPQGGGDAPMPPEQAQQLLSSLGITPDNLQMVIKAIDAVMGGQGSGGPPAGGPPPA